MMYEAKTRLNQMTQNQYESLIKVIFSQLNNAYF